jgi:hypothetical protein
MGNITRTFKGIDIVVRTRDEHCEPHVHAFHDGEGWELRIYFSFVTPRIIEVDVYHGVAPKQKIVQECMNKVTDNLDKARKLFWEAVKTVCLDNKFVVVVNGEVQPSNSSVPGALRVKTASYNVAQKAIFISAQGIQQPVIGKCP